MDVAMRILLCMCNALSLWAVRLVGKRPTLPRGQPRQPRACGASVRVVMKGREWNRRELCHDNNNDTQAVLSRQHVSLSEPCSVFYISVQNATTQKDTRTINVKNMLERFPDIRVMSAVSWRTDWDNIKALFKRMRFPVCNHNAFSCGRKLDGGQGKYARWTSLMLAFAYQIKQQLPCMMLLEDDVEIVNNDHFRQVRTSFPRVTEAYLHRCGDWGQCLISNPAGASAFLNRLYKYGISTHSDIYMMHILKDIRVPDFDVPPFLRLLVPTNTGDIRRAPTYSNLDFDYDSTDVPDLSVMDTAFDHANLTSAVVDLVKVARLIASQNT